MEKKKKFNWLVPTPICEAIEPAMGQLNDKQKWLCGSAAMLFFLKASETEQQEMIRQLAGADATDTVKELVEAIQNDKGTAGRIKPQSPPARAARKAKPNPKGRKAK